MDDATKDYHEGLRDGRILSLETTVKELTEDMKKMKTAMYMLYGAIALVQFLPDLKELLFRAG